ncbi:hypothetical protein [Mycobacterium intracellulare]|uniref:glycine-rich domain-containing protein n=1 Tax=Mycobacterium intracellulare TaxID=1767 RepID=UPI000BAAB5B3|nr:hypothetical protein [Mycobacterium intracellulare]ASW84760.1 hypothetical protein CKJ61_07535 [Mycobacterium intracellulare]
MTLSVWLASVQSISVGNTPVSTISVGDRVVWSTFTPELATFAAAGAYTYNIPAGCRFIDVILLGAGSGGNAGGAGFVSGNGGAAGHWAIITLERGVDIPWSVKQITGVIGAGGTQGIYGGAAPTSGGGTSAIASSWAGLTAAGGVFVNSGGSTGKAPSPASQTVNGQTYPAGAAGKGGNGGAGGFVSGSSGSPGAPGEAWFYAY